MVDSTDGGSAGVSGLGGRGLYAYPFMILLRGRAGPAEGAGEGVSPGLGRDHSELNELVRGVFGIGV